MVTDCINAGVRDELRILREASRLSFQGATLETTLETRIYLSFSNWVWNSNFAGL